MHSYFITHPEVNADPYIPVEQWGLSDAGRIRAAGLASHNWLGRLQRIITSTEEKARETGAILADLTGVSFATDPELCENDRSATGFLPPSEFVSHGAVGTHPAQLRPHRDLDQPQLRSGWSGNYFEFDPIGWTVSHPWRRIEPR
ncbi:histidine phosphatase family protein [Paenarthrobacter sp. Z7-10]|uniref:hypothetical protein n=1 Tax=Paenarthrobacter sp. Z7-10 TaxID=2787635 RepID=UPI0022A92A62|nr:hypothetical protein [Paenarthrobacter sp. Z7-10]MCZ2403157.1 histidine phosphatase family protein [Paenarthrobacter sp. Z7-10]